MPEPLLSVVEQRLGVAIDPDSDGGWLLGALTPRPPFDAQGMSGQADVSPLTLMVIPDGVTVRAAQGGVGLPAGPLDFRLVPPTAADPPRVEIELASAVVPLPFLTAATATADGTLTAAAGTTVELHLPPLLLVGTAPARPASSVGLAPGPNAAAALQVTMSPSAALIGPGTVLGLTQPAQARCVRPDTIEAPRARRAIPFVRWKKPLSPFSSDRTVSASWSAYATPSTAICTANTLASTTTATGPALASAPGSPGCRAGERQSTSSANASSTTPTNCPM